MTNIGGTTAALSGAQLVRFADTATAPPSLLFLDANIVLDIFEHEAANRGNKTISGASARKSPALISCLPRLVAKKSKLFVTPAVLEEVFHVLWLRVLSGAKAKWACSGCAPRNTPDKEVRRHHPSDFATARAATIRIFTGAWADVRKHSVRIWLPGDEPGVIGQKVLDAFLATLTRHDGVGGKDALHIATARLFECETFVSRDEGFQEVSGITVYCP